MARTCGVILAFLCGSACVAELDTGEEARTVSDQARDDTRVIDVSDISPGSEPDVCELLPHCGPCSMACDPQALAALIPPGTCAAFLCELVDGRHATFHACHH
jgi:hypothetical protein